MEFYDLSEDPAGLKNLSADASQASQVANFKRLLDEWIESSHDRGALPDPATEPSLEAIQKDKRGDYQRTWNTRLGKSEPTDAERLAWWQKLYGLND